MEYIDYFKMASGNSRKEKKNYIEKWQSLILFFFFGNVSVRISKIDCTEYIAIAEPRSLALPEKRATKQELTQSSPQAGKPPKTAYSWADKKTSP